MILESWTVVVHIFYIVAVVYVLLLASRFVRAIERLADRQIPPQS